MSDRCHPDGALVICELIDDSIGADTQRAEAMQPSAERVSGLRIALKQSERILDCVDQLPVQLKQLVPGAPRKNNLGHASTARTTLGQIGAKLIERDALASS